jgi:hypothetical protein
MRSRRVCAFFGSRLLHAMRISTDMTNLTKGATTPNMVVVPIAPDGTINIYNYSGTTHVIADIVGYYT